jgi:hypothetical protein
VLFIYHLIPRKIDCLGWFAALGTTPVSRFLGASCSVLGRLQYKSASFWVSVNRYALHRDAYEIWWRIVHLGSEK